jgi:hypothetical protein
VIDELVQHDRGPRVAGRQAAGGLARSYFLDFFVTYPNFAQRQVGAG